ncbi:Alpha/Beta hydrolase protein [Aspergillus cavernicola]|uniref:Alpha/Beta hydrolase protein n=1 Tax=Aspergillus cavernicola TaxID=176166 RepID=A0ABR4IMJ7_9EURO
MNLFIAALFGLLWPLWSWFQRAPSLPQVNLGYEIHEALFYNDVTMRYTFRNIRYAQAPVGGLRYACPVAPSGGVNPIVQRGNESRICASDQIPIPGDERVGEDALSRVSTLTSSNANATVTEDCLFLDVVVPKCIFEGRNRSPAKVYVTYGISDDEDSITVDKEGILKDGLDGAVMVGVNYRRGSLAKPTSSKSIPADLGEADQGLALEWVREHIHRFGGDSKLIYSLKFSYKVKKTL